MATLTSKEGDISVRLLTRSTIGRSPGNHMVLSAPVISGSHALIEWRQGGWLLRDQASSNGTYVDGQRVVLGNPVVLRPGVCIAFGGPAKNSWIVSDTSPPVGSARCIRTGERKWAEQQILSLDEDPDCWADVVEQTPGVWFLERPGVAEPVADGQVLEVGGNAWQLDLAVPSEATQSASSPWLASNEEDGVCLEFLPSPSGDRVVLRVENPPAEPFEIDRAFTKMLFLLAQKRAKDRAQAPQASSDHGWIAASDLVARLEFESESRLNVEIHRARKLLGRRGLPSAAGIIERHRKTKSLRIAGARFRFSPLQ